MWGKILAGAAIGVGAIAAAPFTGGGSLLGGASLVASLSGAGAVAAATGAGLAGAVVGGAMADMQDDEMENAKNEGRAKGKASVQADMDQVEERLKSALKKLQSHDEIFKAIIALEAVGVSCAACDGEFSENEKEEIGQFVMGMLDQKIPQKVKDKIQRVFDNPPTIKEAFILAKESGIPMQDYEDLIRFVMEVDGVKEEERVFVHTWDQLRAAA